MTLKVGDKVRWVTDVDKVYSEFTKTFVGKVGTLVDAKERKNASTYENLPDCLDIEFETSEIEYKSGKFRVWNIPLSELEGVNS